MNQAANSLRIVLSLLHLRCRLDDRPSGLAGWRAGGLAVLFYACQLGVRARALATTALLGGLAVLITEGPLFDTEKVDHLAGTLLASLLMGWSVRPSRSAPGSPQRSGWCPRSSRSSLHQDLGHREGPASCCHDGTTMRLTPAGA
jgi:hypothetical protein